MSARPARREELAELMGRYLDASRSGDDIVMHVRANVAG